MTPAIPLTVIGGYLGAGKTTLVNRILTGGHGRRIAVIVNDFGDVAIDELLIESPTGTSSPGTVRALANGCVCCTVVDGFAATLREIAALEPLPEHLLVEVSGVGDPWAVAQWGRTPGFVLDGVVVVVDPTSLADRIEDPYVGATVKAQLAGADVVLLSRADVVDETELDTAEAVVAAHGAAPVLRGTDGSLDLLIGRPTVGVAAAGEHADHRSWSCVPAPIDRGGLTEWLADAPAGVMRVKGIVDDDSARGSEPVQLLGQLVGHRAEVTRYHGPAPPSAVMTVVATDAATPAAVAEWLSRLDG